MHMKNYPNHPLFAFIHFCTFKLLKFNKQKNETDIKLVNFRSPEDSVIYLIHKDTAISDLSFTKTEAAYLKEKLRQIQILFTSILFQTIICDCH